MSFAWVDTPFRALLYVIVFVLGVLVGMEIPLVIRALDRSDTRLGDVVARVLTFDYLGALAVSLLFPLLLAPWLGLTRTAFLFGMINVGVALFAIINFAERVAYMRQRILTASILLVVHWHSVFLAPTGWLPGVSMACTATRWWTQSIRPISASSSPGGRMI